MPRTKALLAAITIAACLPYLTLKVIWLSGGTVGIPDDSPLLDGGGTLWTLNAVTVAMDATVILLVLALTRPWGLRLPAPLLLLPLWAASGLLGPVVVAFPVQAMYGTLAGNSGGGGPGNAHGTGPGNVLDGWVWTVVYTGFTLQALALGALLVLYVRTRWGTLLRTRLGSSAVPSRVRTAWRPAFAVGTVLALLSAVPHVLWAAGSDVGLGTGSGADGSAESHITDSAFALFTLAAVAGLWPLTRGGPHLGRESGHGVGHGEGNGHGHGAGRSGVGGRGPRLVVPLAAVWAGTGVMTCWGLWLLMGALTGGGKAVGQRTTGFVELAYAGQTLAGLVLTLLGAHILRRHAEATEAERAGGRAKVA